MIEQQPLLDVKDLSTGYEDTQVLERVAMTVYPRETVVLLGPNGHGKTTLLRTICGLHRAWSGEILFAGDDIQRKSPNHIAARGLVYIPQGDLLFGDMTVAENLLCGAYLRSAWRGRRERLDMVWTIFPHLRTIANRPARNLSGGERRMVAIGRGLMTNGTMMLVDEPSLGLAPIAIDAVYNAFRELRTMGITILIVEELIERAGALADRLYLLDAGQIVLEGPAGELLRDQAMLEAYLG
jgi:branched-chain amino acid transport system ATP-binding protein